MNLFDLCVYKNLNKGSGGDVDVSSLVATENKTYNAGEGKAYNPVVVNVPTPSPSLQSLTVSHNGYFVPSSGYDGFDEVTVDVATPLETLSATENGTYTPSSGYEGFSEVTVDVPLPNNAYLLESQKDDVVTIQNGAEFDMPKLIASIEPQQSGSGDPSPENVRPISGWTACNVARTGKNIFDKSQTLTSGLIDSSGAEVENASYRHTDYIPTKPNTNYIVSGSVVGSTLANSIAYYDSDKTFISRFVPNIGENAQFLTPNNCAFIRMNFGNAQTSDVNTIQIEEGQTATSYEAFGTTYTINFVDGSSPLTVYGGTLDVRSGLLTVDRAFVDMSEITAEYNSGWNCWTISTSVLPNAKIIDNNNTPTTAISDRLKAVKASGYTTSHESGTMAQNTSNMWFIDNGSTTELSGQLVYELATPQTYQLTPTQVKSLLGVNSIFADTGEVDVQIWTKEVTS